MTSGWSSWRKWFRTEAVGGFHSCDAVARDLARASLVTSHVSGHSRAMASTSIAPTARLSGIPRYTQRMPKVMVSMPEDLLAEVDAEADRTGSTRSAVLREFAEAALRRRRSDRAAAMRALFRETAITDHGGETAERIKESRPGQ